MIIYRGKYIFLQQKKTLSHIHLSAGKKQKLKCKHKEPQNVACRQLPSSSLAVPHTICIHTQQKPIHYGNNKELQIPGAMTHFKLHLLQSFSQNKYECHVKQNIYAQSFSSQATYISCGQKHTRYFSTDFCCSKALRTACHHNYCISA